MMSNLGFEQKARKKKPKPKKERPSTEGCYSSVFIPCGDDLDPHQIKEILTEIAWCVYAASVSRQRQKIAQPFMDQVLTRPKGGITSFIYNYGKMGITSPKEKVKKKDKMRRESKEMSIEKRIEEEKKKGVLTESFKVFKKKEPNTYLNKELKSILKKPKQDNDEQPKQKKRVKFCQEVQIFYRNDADLVVEQEGSLAPEEDDEVKA